MKGVGNQSVPGSWVEEKHENKGPSRSKFWWWRRRIAIIVAPILFIWGLALGLGLGLGLDWEEDGTGTDTIVDLGYSQYRGQAFKDGTSQWRGMRYAAAPVGHLRFAAPMNPPPTDRLQSALKVSRCACLAEMRFIDLHRKVLAVCPHIPRSLHAVFQILKAKIASLPMSSPLQMQIMPPICRCMSSSKVAASMKTRGPVMGDRCSKHQA
jgi:hypothetical protein